MGKAYSLDLRRSICRYIAAGKSRRSAGRIFGLSAATAVRIAAGKRECGEVSVKPHGRAAGKFGKLAPHIELLIEIVRAETDITLQELSNALEDTYGVHVHRVIVKSGV
jgi:transposase